ncbi:MAG: winged helix-turn-helix transcriptional regulator [Candidatus Micrarchaeota archaeon]|nr:winged helix-turn-helix transcriptional regulator [Candidatus Micrarchaeota archaeon]
MNFSEFAARLGLTEKQRQIYECLFSLGSASAADIAQRTGMNRTLIYDHLNILVEKGLISFSTVNNKRSFTALEPKTLVRNLEDEIGELENKRKRELEQLRRSLPELESYFNTKDRAAVGILLGQKGVRNLFGDIVSSLKRGEEDAVFIANYEGRELLGSAILNYYAQCRKKGIKIRVIFDSRPKTLRIGKETAKFSNVRVRFLPAQYSTLTTFHVYGGKASMLLFSEGEVFGLLIENKKVAAGMKKQFEALWSMSHTHA